MLVPQIVQLSGFSPTEAQPSPRSSFIDASSAGVKG
jgi:hypothetical protein